MRACLGLWLTVSLVLLSGCGPKSSQAHLSGQVTFRGEPVRGGMVFFKAFEPGGRVEEVYGPIEADGRYSVIDVPVGRVGVGVSTRMVETDWIPNWPSERGSCPWVFTRIPASYTDPLRSGIETAVKPGAKQTFDIVLE